MTLRVLLDLLKKQQGSDEAFEKALDLPLSIGIRDGKNFDSAKVYVDYPHYREPREEFPGMVRIDGYLDRTRLVTKTKRD